MLGKKLSFHWGTPAMGESRHLEEIQYYILEAVEAGVNPGEERQISFALDEVELPAGILP